MVSTIMDLMTLLTDTATLSKELQKLHQTFLTEEIETEELVIVMVNCKILLAAFSFINKFFLV